ncbi:hypothetical protein C8F01DRAFT_1266804 [Mycena amicta]|nr:hypothetical protein C8F01DRAFT_1266804 [Mycena amicta]
MSLHRREKVSPDRLLEHIALFLLSILCATHLALKLSAPSTQASLHRPQAPNETYIPSLPLRVSPAAMTFMSTEFYALDANEEWASLIPYGHGWVRLGMQREPFAVSMYHQLHCLESIRLALLHGHQNPSPQLKSHTNHCFNYLRQLLLCKADMTLEPTNITRIASGKLLASASGEDVVHVCKDWVQVRRFVEANMRQ